jgi:tRNA pseudouridine55 synthase
MLSAMDGILLIDKPKGWTSFDVVAKIRGLVRKETGQKKPKVGHTGTLDPLATGLMIVVLGKYTKRAEEFSKLDKTYEVTMRLGQTSTTGDEEGEKTDTSDRIPSRDEIDAVLRIFVGKIEQVPPAFSAMKIDGQRAYKLARAGKEVKLEPRPVTIHSINLDDYSYPEAIFTADVSSGTYIRSLVEDTGHKLGTGAYTSDLRRTKVGKFSVQDAQTVEGLNNEDILSHLITLA